jgi:hypothetical protein
MPEPEGRGFSPAVATGKGKALAPEAAGFDRGWIFVKCVPVRLCVLDTAETIAGEKQAEHSEMIPNPPPAKLPHAV